MSYRIEEEDGVLTFTIDRPHIMNAINDEVMEGLSKFIERAKNPAIRFAVITASGDRAFCSGGDLSVFHTLKTEDQAHDMLSRMANLLYAIKTLPVPVIADINGAAVGGGCEIATACDMRLVKSGVKCGFIQGTLAITTGWGGGSYLMNMLPADKAMRMLTEARPFTSEELNELGWATAVIKSPEEKERFMGKLKAVHPDVHRAYKEMALRPLLTSKLKEHIDQEVRRCAQLWEREAHHDAVDRFLTKSKK